MIFQTLNATHLSIAEFVAVVADGRSQDEKNLVRILKVIVPHLAGHADMDQGMEDATFHEFTATCPAVILLDCLGTDGKWAPELVAAVPSLAEIKAYKDDYRRCLVRCLDHAIARRLIPASARGVAPEWLSARSALDEVLPYNQKRLRERLDAGETELFGHTLKRKTEKTTYLYFRTMLDGFNLFGRHMTSLGVLRPQDVHPEHFYGPDNSFYAETKRRNPEAQTTYYRAAFAWRILSGLKPEWQLADVPEPKKAREYGLKPHEMPKTLIGLKDEAHQAAAAQKLSTTTLGNYEEHLKRLCGFLKHEQGLDLDGLCREVDDPEELGYLLGGGYPVLDGFQDPAPEEEARLVFEDTRYREAILGRIRRANRAHEAKEACRPNPLLALYKRFHLQRGTASSLEVGLKASRIMSQHYLKVHKTQLAWKSDLISDTLKAKKRQRPSERSRRKVLVGTDRDLWLKMVAARPRIAAHTEKLRQAMIKAQADPKLKENQKANARMRYAIAVRDELMVALLLAFQLRKENIQGLKLGEDIVPAQYRILLPPESAKADEPILKTFPDKGPFADLKALLDAYLTEARPIILGARAETPYCFLSYSRGQSETHDEGGHLRGGREQLSKVMQRVCKLHFSDILPPGLNIFNVHLARDILVGYVYGKEDAEAIICQALNNTPETAKRHYNNISRLADDGIKEFIENVDTSKASEGRKGKLKRREDLRKKLILELGPDADPSLVNRLMRVVDSHA